MGYTSCYWAYRPSDMAYSNAWPTILADTRRIIDRVRQTGIVIAALDGRRHPIPDEADGIAFNSDASTDLDYETFQLLAPRQATPAGVPIATGFYKTNRNPCCHPVYESAPGRAERLADCYAFRYEGGAS